MLENKVFQLEQEKEMLSQENNMLSYSKIDRASLIQAEKIKAVEVYKLSQKSNNQKNYQMEVVVQEKHNLEIENQNLKQ